MVYRSGIDWSGDSGNPNKQGSLPYLSIALVEVIEDDFPEVQLHLGAIAKALRLRDGYVFHYTNSNSTVRNAFFTGIKKLPLFATVYVPDKGLWLPAIYNNSTGAERIDGCIAELLCNAINVRPGGRNLTIDGSRSEQATLNAARKAISLAVGGKKSGTLVKVKFGPDDRNDGALLQIADMIAGAARDGIEGSGYLERIRKNLTVL